MSRLPGSYPTATIVLRETKPGEGFRDSRIDISVDGIAIGAGGFQNALQALGVVTLPTYFGHVATGAIYPTQLRATGAPTQANFRSFHIARDETPTQIAYRNFSGNAEAGSGAPLALDVSLQDEAGNILQLTWGGQVGVTIPSGAESPLCDPHPKMKKGTRYFYRSNHQCASGILVSPIVGTVGNGTQGEFGTGALTNKVMGGTIPTSVNFCAPSLIVGMTSQPSFGLVGDSLTAIVGDTLDDMSPDGGLGRAFSAAFGYQRQAIGGETMANFMGANGAKRRAALAYASHIACFYGRNDLSGGATAVALAALMTQLAAQYPTKPLIVSTITPVTTSTDAWATTANQTVVASEAQRIIYNEMVRSGQIPGVVGYIDPAAAVETSLNSGIWIPGLIFTTDNTGTHPNKAGYQAIRQATTPLLQRLVSVRP